MNLFDILGPVMVGPSSNIHVHIVINSLRIAEVPFLPYMDRPADTRAGMPEVICFGMLILFYGLAFSYLNKETKGKLIAMFIVSVLLTLMRPYMLLFLLLACFFRIRRSRKSGWIVSASVVAVTGVVYVLIKHYLGAEYFTPLFYTDWITTFFTDGIGAGVRNFLGTLHWKGLEFYRLIFVLSVARFFRSFNRSFCSTPSAASLRFAISPGSCSIASKSRPLFWNRHP